MRARWLKLLHLCSQSFGRSSLQLLRRALMILAVPAPALLAQDVFIDIELVESVRLCHIQHSVRDRRLSLGVGPIYSDVWSAAGEDDVTARTSRDAAGALLDDVINRLGRSGGVAWCSDHRMRLCRHSPLATAGLVRTCSAIISTYWKHTEMPSPTSI